MFRQLTRTSALGALFCAASFGAIAADSSPMTKTPTEAAASAAMGASAAHGGMAASAGGNAGMKADAKGGAGSGALPSGDRKFVEKAAHGGLMEVELGKLAQSKATSDEVKSFGSRMVDDHGKANAELMQLASARGVTVPQSLDKSHQKDVDKLGKLSGDEFDRKYMKMMVSDHKKDVSEFEKASKSLKDPELKNFAGKTLPTLKEHLQLAQKTEASVSKAH